MSTTEPAALVTGDQHPCGDAGFAVFQAGWVEQSLPDRFGRMVAAHRDCLAVADAAGRTTYGQLDELTGRIAGAIVERLGAGWEPVALVLRQGLISVAATLGTLRAGKAYAPLDPSDPPARLAEIAEHLGARLILVDRETAPLAEAMAGPGRDLLVVNDLPRRSGPPPEIDVPPGAIAYVYFTSGSTGRPKGVVNTHRNVLHNVLRYTNALRISPSDRLSLLQAPSFSGAVSSTFGALLNGAALFPFSFSGERLEDLAAMVRAERVTVYHSVPSILRGMVAVSGDIYPDVRVVRLEGDRASSLDVELHRRHFSAGSILANGLGTTETGLCRQLRVPTTAPVAEGVLPVGYPVPDVNVAVVDEEGLPLPAGSAGEIAVAEPLPRARVLAATGAHGRGVPSRRRGSLVPDLPDRGSRSSAAGWLPRVPRAPRRPAQGARAEGGAGRGRVAAPADPRRPRGRRDHLRGPPGRGASRRPRGGRARRSRPFRAARRARGAAARPHGALQPQGRR